MKSLAWQVVFVGLEYHQDSVQVCVMDATGKVLLNKKFANSWGEIVNAVRRYGGQVQAAIAQFERFQTGKQLARFCGLSPRNASSGAKQADAGLIKAGNKGLRAVLIEAGHRLLRLDDRWGALGAKLSAKGKPKSVVVAAVTNRWIRWLFHQMQPENLATAA